MITIDQLVCRITVRILPTRPHLTVRKFWSAFYPLTVRTSAGLHFTVLHVAAAAPCSGTSILRVSTVTFLPTALKPQHRPRTWVYLRKANET